jgi:hypothetical protein
MQDLIDVRFCLDGLPAPEYADPNDLGTGHRVTRYIEVVAGQCFNINVRVLQNFSLRFAPELYAKLEVDNQETFMYSHLSCKGLKHSRGRLQQEPFLDERRGMIFADIGQSTNIKLEHWVSVGSHSRSRGKTTKSYSSGRWGIASRNEPCRVWQDWFSARHLLPS